MADQEIDFASKLQAMKTPQTTDAGFVDFASVLSQPGIKQRPLTSSPEQAEAQSTQVEEPSVSDDFMKSEFFAGEQYFDYRIRELDEEKKALMRDRMGFLGLKQLVTSPFGEESKESIRRQGEIVKEKRRLMLQKAIWQSGIPEHVRNLPELTAQINQGGEKFTGALLAGVLAPQEQDRLDILENFGWDVDRQQGFSVVTNPETGEQFQVNAPGLSQRDLIDFFATAIQFAPAARTTGLVTKIGPRVGVGATAAGLTELAKQGIEEALGGQFDLSEVGISTLFGGAAEVAIPALRGIWNKLSPKGRERLLAAQTVDDIKKLGIASQDELANIQQLVDRTRTAQAGVKEVTGVEVPVFRAQATGIPSDLLMQRFLGQLDPTSRKALESLRGQNEKAFEATIAMLNKVAPEETIEIAGRQIRDASQALIDARRLTQIEASSPIYKQAYRRQRQGKVPLLDMTDFSTKYKNIARQFEPKAKGVKDEIAESLKDVVRRVEAAKGDLRQLHNVKMHIDRALEKTGSDSLARSSKRFLRDVQKDLVEQLAEKSPSYRVARGEFIRTQGPIDELQDMAIGRTASLDDSQLDQAGRAFFDRNATPGSVEKARKLILGQPNGKDVWDQVIRKELHNRVSGLEELVADQGVESIANMPGKLRTAIFGNPNQRKVLMRAVDPETRKNLSWLDQVLSSTATGRAAGSPTSPFNVIKDKLVGRLRVAREAIRSPLGAVAGIGEESLFNRNARAIVDIMYDERWLERMSKIRAMEPNSAKAGKLLSETIDQASRMTAQAIRPEFEQPPRTKPQRDQFQNIK